MPIAEKSIKVVLNKDNYETLMDALNYYAENAEFEDTVESIDCVDDVLKQARKNS